jgi:hypothetical protein
MEIEDYPIPARLDYRIRGMDCAEEVLLLRRQLEHRAGVLDLAFDVFHARMSVEFDEAALAGPGRAALPAAAALRGAHRGD